MSAPAIQRAPSGRFSRTYYMVWGLLAAGGLTYLASLGLPIVFPGKPSTQQVAVIDPELGVRVANRALAEVGSVQQTVRAIQSDLGRLKDTVDQREVQERYSQARLSAVEERLTALATPPVAAEAPVSPHIISPKQKAAEKKAASEKRAAEQHATARAVSAVEGPSPASPPAADPAPQAAADAPKIETGSIPASSAATVTFGEAQVTPARQAYSVQVGAGPSVDALRLTWGTLVERHGALAVLQPRFVAPKPGSGIYRLVAGPLASKADAEKVCADMGVGHQGCLPTTSVGKPL
jgi:hypothetical protein